MATIEKSIDVNVPVTTAYNQWTQFEEFPRFMEHVVEVRQEDDKRLHWVAEVSGERKEWDAEIVRQEPDRMVSWRSTSGTRNDGKVTFSNENGGTRVTLCIDYEPEGLKESVGSAVGIPGMNVQADLESFKQLVEQRGHESGAWRGRIEGDHVEPEGPGRTTGGPGFERTTPTG